MTRQEIIEVLIIERTCVERQGTPLCDRKCEACDLCLPTDKVVKAYEQTIDILHQEPSRKGYWTSTVCYARTDNGVLLMGFECSECGKITFISPAMHTPKGCPFCMADMTKEGREYETN